MRKLTPNQQEVIDLMKQGWELGSELSIGGGCRLQKGGLGRGDETLTISPSTLRTLDYLGYIEVASSNFPTKHWCLKGQKPTTKEIQTKTDPLHGDDYSHPSYGMISFSRGQGSDATLFGSSIKHHNTIRVTISHAERHMDNGTEHIFDRARIVEAIMSPTQFADAITGMNTSGVPITLQWTAGKGHIDSPEFINKREGFEKEFTERVRGIKDKMSETIEKAKDKKAPRWLVHDLEITKGWFESNIPYLAEQFDEQMDKSVTEAKAEIEAYVSAIIHQTGLQALEDMRPQITESEDNDPKLITG
ncbi:hypothetical protein LCGC14_0543710 [marine sediment metagenome]|uniref:Uncharacterized protein n=1 Tax=marine sediment metagenome TaxID=412755 RepID=A0A0F9SAJ7_9ZZZZ